MIDPPVQDDRLVPFLKRHLNNNQFAEVMEVLGPYHRIVQSDEGYPLNPPDKLNQEAILAALALALGRNQREIQLSFRSLSAPPTTLSWMSRDGLSSLGHSLRNSFGCALGRPIKGSLEGPLLDLVSDYFWDPLWNSIKKSIQGPLWNFPEVSLRNFFGDSFWESLATRLRNSLLESLRNSVMVFLWYSLDDSCKTSLYYYLVLVMTNEPKLANRLVPLLQILPEALILGNRKDDPQTFIVICA